MWTVGIYATQTGQLELPVQVSSGSWETRLTGRGSGRHVIPLHGTTIPQTLVNELDKGHKYTIVQCWGNDVAYPGVIVNSDYDYSTNSLLIESSEFRAAEMNDRMLYGVPAYAGTSTLLNITSKSHSGAVRAVDALAMSYNSDWAYPIDLSAAGSGSFNATWTFAERLKWEDHIAQIEADGCEVDRRGYLDGSGKLRWETRVMDQIKTGSPTDLAVAAQGSLVSNLHVLKNSQKQMTGVLAFGKNGRTKFSPVSGGTYDIPIRDTLIDFPDIDDDTRLQAAADTAYLQLHNRTEQWSFDLHIWPTGPAFAAPGRLLNLWVYGDVKIPDGKHAHRVVALSGDMGFTVTPEVQYAA